MKSRHVVFLILATLIMALIWVSTSPQPTPVEISDSPQPAAIPPLPPAVETAPPAAAPLNQTIKPAPAPASNRRDLENPLAPASFQTSPSPRPAEADPEVAPELDKITLMLRDYRSITGENPVGTNAEIMKAILGENPRGAKLGPPEGMSLNGAGELIDHWGTPFFFHQLSKDLMEIHSAGPDRLMGTEDDLVFK